MKTIIKNTIKGMTTTKELNEVIRLVRQQHKFIEQKAKKGFAVGDKVNVMHPSNSPTQVFTITKINGKSISVKDRAGCVYTATPSLLKAKK